ncbi:MAG: hypothetical protein CVU77_04375 [Elusimicrobia bacterium HGW-Elusimicrobia-1]|jgi:Zn-dependent peptidase ImmA (M78 family)/DNA-binding XRE family transcriptional regulator|nr:MAG: hypothetical protein CVU77_04375 [Elusimicrobia bacterium HGW-Elusimicrobia-1]
MNIADRLRSVRNALGMKLADVSEKTGIGISSLSEIENGKREPMLIQLKKLSELYERPLSFFFETTEISSPALLWREKPGNEIVVKQLEAKFTKWCRQYRNLEIWTNWPRLNSYEDLFVSTYPKNFPEVRRIAHDTWKKMDLGARPGESLFRVMEEVYAVKVFHFTLEGDTSSACIYSENFGAAIMLNKNSKQWRRNYDLAHELFHLVTWKVRKDISPDGSLTQQDEQNANVFASALLMPVEALREAVESFAQKDKDKDKDKMLLSIDAVDSIARQFGVSVDALLWRLCYVYGMPNEYVKNIIQGWRDEILPQVLPRKSKTPDMLPDRYRDLANKALNNGLISSKQFANYLAINVSEVYARNIPQQFDDVQINNPTC